MPGAHAEQAHVELDAARSCAAAVAFARVRNDVGRCPTRHGISGRPMQPGMLRDQTANARRGYNNELRQSVRLNEDALEAVVGGEDGRDAGVCAYLGHQRIVVAKRMDAREAAVHGQADFDAGSEHSVPAADALAEIVAADISRAEQVCQAKRDVACVL